MQKELVYEQHLSLTTYSRTKTFLDPADTFIPSCFNKNIKSILIYLDPAAFYQFALKLETRLCNLRRIRDCDLDEMIPSQTKIGRLTITVTYGTTCPHSSQYENLRRREGHRRSVWYSSPIDTHWQSSNLRLLKHQ